VIGELRQEMIAEADNKAVSIDLSPEGIERRVEAVVQAMYRPGVRPAINATGVILHTGMGRAPLAEPAREALAAAVRNYCTLEIDPDSGERGSRHDHVESLLRLLTGAEAACVVNNNAAAVLLALNTLAEGREVPVSRGQLVEIGGAFRMPDVMRQSGAVMVEVGTTNRTHADDYRRAICERTAMIQTVHPSNFRIEGFTSEVPLSELKEICNGHDIPLVQDIGSGCLLDLTAMGLPPEPVVAESIAAGADVVTFSGDKIMGGPQCGILAGKTGLIERIKRNSLMRALRCDKVIYAALEATLKLYLDRDTLFEKLPVLRMATESAVAVGKRAKVFATRLKKSASSGYGLELVDGESQMGSGTMPGYGIPTCLMALTCERITVDQLAQRLRRAEPPVFARIADNRLLLDLRTVHPDEESTLAAILTAALTS
jgi:L-seryl-tRNA(Ser) seleniumtransferase